MQPSVFDKLHPKIRTGLDQLGIINPTPPQISVIQPIFEGENVLLIAPTASGKTESALLPVFDMHLRSMKETGISIIYITPLRALNRDIEKRMIFWADHLGISVEVRHGDTSQKQRRRQSRKPPQMLITTPETLQAILPTKSMRKHLTTVKWVIIDEIHDLAASKRGAQLTIGLERLEEVTDRSPQRIGLSATIGNPQTVAAFLGGKHNVRILEVEVDKNYVYEVNFPQPTDRDYDLADELQTSPKAASRINRVLDLVRMHNSSLIFVQGRGQAEGLGFRLKQLDANIEVHHGSLSREQRHKVEDLFKEGKLKGIVCTSTLQLGIDVGEVDLSIQYQSPRQVNALIQRVGRSGHKLGVFSEGITIPAYGEDALESLIASDMARRKSIEPTQVHMKPLDVLTHQIVGLTLGNEDGIHSIEIYELIIRAYPFHDYSETEFEELIDFLEKIGLIKKEGKTLRKTGKGRRYYYENLGMINDERRYPFINAITDEMIGTVGDEFWSLRARVGLNVILRGRVWRILQIDEERGVIHALPSTDPLGAAPGWDGELIPVSREIAEESGRLRERIHESLQSEKEELIKSLETDEGSLEEIENETQAHLKSGLPLPKSDNLILEIWGQYLVIHSVRGENFNRTLGAVLDAALSKQDLIYNWWNDPYRILIESPNKLNQYEIDVITKIISNLTSEEAEILLLEYMHSRFPFGYKMKFIAERFGVIPRGKIMGPDRVENLYYRFKDTPIYNETLREAYHEKLDLMGLKEVISQIQGGQIQVISKKVFEPSAIAKHILEKYSDIEELMATDATITDQIKYMKENIEARTVTLTCVNCGEWHTRIRIRELDDHPKCATCGSGLLAMMRRHQSPEYLFSLLKKWRQGDELFGEDLEQLVHARKTADMVLSYGRKAVEALMVYGVGPVTSYQVLSRMHRSDEEFYKDLLRAKIQYMKTRQYWADK